jgi:hypothetical protein
MPTCSQRRSAPSLPKGWVAASQDPQQCVNTTTTRVTETAVPCRGACPQRGAHAPPLHGRGHESDGERCIPLQNEVLRRMATRIRIEHRSINKKLKRYEPLSLLVASVLLSNGSIRKTKNGNSNTERLHNVFQIGNIN